MANGLRLPNRVPTLNPQLANHVCYRNCYLAENGNQLYTLIMGLSTCSCGVCQCLANNSTNIEPIGHYLLVCWFSLSIDRSNIGFLTMIVKAIFLLGEKSARASIDRPSYVFSQPYLDLFAL